MANLAYNFQRLPGPRDELRPRDAIDGLRSRLSSKNQQISHRNQGSYAVCEPSRPHHAEIRRFFEVSNSTTSNRRAILPTSSPRPPATGLLPAGMNSCRGTGGRISNRSPKPPHLRPPAHAYGKPESAKSSNRKPIMSLRPNPDWRKSGGYVTTSFSRCPIAWRAQRLISVRKIKETRLSCISAYATAPAK